MPRPIRFLAAALLLVGLLGSVALADPPPAAPASGPNPPPAPAPPSAPAPTPRAPLPKGIAARTGDRLITDDEFRVHLAQRAKPELDKPDSEVARVFALIVEETVVDQEAGRLGIVVTDDDVARMRRELDDKVRRRSNGNETLDDIRKNQKMTEEEFRLRLVDAIRRERIASNPRYLGTSLKTDEHERQAQIDIVIGEIQRRAKIERANLPPGVVAKIDGKPVTEAEFGLALDTRLALSEVRRRLREMCVESLLGAEGKALSDVDVEGEIEAVKPLWRAVRDESLDPAIHEMPFETFLQWQFGVSAEELRTNPYRRGLWALRRRLRATVKPEDVVLEWQHGIKGAYGPSIEVTEIIVSFRGARTVSETTPRRSKEDARRIVGEYESRLRSGEALAKIEKEIADAKDRGTLFAHHLVYDQGNDMLIFQGASAVGDGAWTAPIETFSEFHLVRRNAMHAAPSFEEVKDVVRERLVSQKSAAWLTDQDRENIQLGR